MEDGKSPLHVHDTRSKEHYNGHLAHNGGSHGSSNEMLSSNAVHNHSHTMCSCLRRNAISFNALYPIRRSCIGVLHKPCQIILRHNSRRDKWRDLSQSLQRMVICPTRCTENPFSARKARRWDQLEALDVREIGVTDRSTPLGWAMRGNRSITPSMSFWNSSHVMTEFQSRFGEDISGNGIPWLSLVSYGMFTDHSEIQGSIGQL